MATLGGVIGRGTTASKPAAGVAGRLYFDTDLGKLQRDNGSTWEDVAEVTSAAPLDASYVVEDANGTLSGESVLGTTVISKTDYSSRQAAAKAGRLFFPSNSWQVQRDNGAAWESYGPIWGPLTPPLSTDFTWDNQGVATVADEYGGMWMSMPTAAVGSHALYKAAPARPYTLVVAFIPIFPSVNTPAVGVGWRQSSNSLKVISQIYPVGNVVHRITKLNADGTYNSAYFAGGVEWTSSPLVWMKLYEDNSNRVISISQDGVHWIQMHSVGRTDYLTADQLCVAIDANGCGYNHGIYIVHWAVS